MLTAAHRLVPLIVLALCSCSGAPQPDATAAAVASEREAEAQHTARDDFCEAFTVTLTRELVDAAEGLQPGPSEQAEGLRAYREHVRALGAAAPEDLAGDFAVVVAYLEAVEHLLAEHDFDTERLFASPPAEDLERIEAMGAGAAIDAIAAYATDHCDL